MAIGNNNNNLYKGTLATLGFVHLAGYAAVTGDVAPLARAIRSLNETNQGMATMNTTVAPTITSAIQSSSTQPTSASLPPTSSSTQSISTSSAIDIKTKEDLAKLTNSTNHFVLQNDIDANGTESIKDFRGQLDGHGHAITNLVNCLFERLGGYVHRISFTDAHISKKGNENSTDFGVGVAACHTDKKSRLDDVHISNSTVIVDGSLMAAGAVVGINHGQISHAHSHNNQILARGDMSMAGGLVGEMLHGSLSHSTVTNGSVTAMGHSSHAGGIVGIESNALLSNSHVHKAYVHAHEDYSKAGGIVGEMAGDLMHAYVTNTEVHAHAESSHAGGIAGEVMAQAVVADSHIEHSNIKTLGDNSKAGGIAGLSTGSIIHASAHNSTISAAGSSSDVGGIIGHNAKAISHEVIPPENGDYDNYNYDDYDDGKHWEYFGSGDEESSSYDYGDHEPRTTLSNTSDVSHPYVSYDIRRENSQGILNHANSEANNITGHGANCRASATVGVNNGLVFDAESINNTVTGCDTSSAAITPSQDHNVDGDEFELTNWQAAALAAGATVVANSYYNGWKNGERGIKLATRPFRSAASAVTSAICFVKKSVTPSREAGVEYTAALDAIEIDSSATTALVE